MFRADRRQLFRTGGISALALGISKASFAAPAPVTTVCLVKTSEFGTESHESPFFEHFHQLAIPTSALFDPPAAGVIVKTSAIDLGSYDTDAFKTFVTSSGLDSKMLLAHRHDVSLTKADLDRIGRGEKGVEVRVVSANGNYVHNFLITAPPSVLVKVRRHQAKR